MNPQHGLALVRPDKRTSRLVMFSYLKSFGLPKCTERVRVTERTEYVKLAERSLLGKL